MEAAARQYRIITYTPCTSLSRHCLFSVEPTDRIENVLLYIIYINLCGVDLKVFS